MTKSTLPKPNVTAQSHNEDTLDETTMKGMMCNPIYTGIPPFQSVVSDEAWIKAATQLISDEGPEQFLVNMLYTLRESMENHVHAQAIIPIIEDDTDEAEDIRIEDLDLPQYCYHDDFPLIKIHGVYACVAEYLYEHLEASPVTDLLVSPELTLVFQNGHTLPILAKEHRHLVPSSEEDQLLDTLNGLCIVDIEWDDEDQNVIMYFGRSFSANDLDVDHTPDPAHSLAVSLDSIQRMTCPHIH